MCNFKRKIVYAACLLLTVISVIAFSSCDKDRDNIDVETTIRYLTAEEYQSGDYEEKLRDSITTGINQKGYVVIDFVLSNIKKETDASTVIVHIDFDEHKDDFDFNVEDFPTPDYTVLEKSITARLKIFEMGKKKESFRFIISVTKFTDGGGSVSASVNGYSSEYGAVTVSSEGDSESKLALELSSDGSYYTVTGIGNERGERIRIPDKHDGIPVKEIAANAFLDINYLKEIILPEGIEKIGDRAFKGCTGINCVVIPSSVNVMGENVFSGCNGIMVWCVGKSAPDTWSENCLPEDANAVFDSNELFKLDGTSYTFTFLDEKIECDKLVIPENYLGISVTKIKGDGEHEPKSGIKSLTIPSGVSTILSKAFYNCTKLTEINFNAVRCRDQYIDDIIFANAGQDAEGITVTIGDGVKIIPENLFNMSYGTSTGVFNFEPNVKSVSLGKTVNSIRRNAFKNCTGIKEISIPDSVVSIYDGVFGNCTGLTSVSIGKGLVNLSSTSFSGSGYYNDPANWENGVLYIGKHLILASETVSGNYVVKDGTECIAQNAFYKNSGLTGIEIPGSVKVIGNFAFCCCNGLTAVKIPEGVDSIGEDAFSQCNSLISVDISNTVTSIGDGAFFGCDSLSEVIMGKSVSFIGNQAFNTCASLKEIKFRGTKQQWNTIYKEMGWDTIYTYQTIDKKIYKIIYKYKG